MMTNEQFLLVKLAEEASEIAQIALKAAQFGMDEVYPKDGRTNGERIQAELDDLHGVVNMLNREEGFMYVTDVRAMTAKAGKVDKYRNYSRSLGLVEPELDHPLTRAQQQVADGAPENVDLDRSIMRGEHG